MIRYLLPKEGNFYKANLHSHCIISDGRLNPEEVKEIYKSKGYSVYAFTDHDIFLNHNDLRDDDFLPLNGYEVEINEDGDQDFSLKKCCHLCFIALEPDNLKAVALHRNRYMFANAISHKDEMIFDDAPDYVRHYSPEGINEMIAMARNAGFFVTYNHPTWSLEAYPEYVQYKGMNALEIYNGACIVNGMDDINPRVYDDMLRNGQRIAVTGSDDNHNGRPLKHTHNDNGVAWTMIKAPKLEYRSVTHALEQGDYYASTGPEIKALYVEDGIMKVESSPVCSIVFSTGIRRCWRIASHTQDVTQGAYEVSAFDKYVRVTLTDSEGHTASSRAYFTDEIF